MHPHSTTDPALKPREVRKRPIPILRRILCGNRLFASVDDQDYERLAAHEWKINNKGYAYRSERQNDKTIQIFMHREVMSEELCWRKGYWDVHHVNEDKLDNRRKNLLVVDKRFHARAHTKRLRLCG